jgi:hypothetical protein
MSKFATLMIAAALLCPAFAQAMPKAPAMVAGDEETIPTPEKKATAHRAKKAKRAKKAAEASAAPAAAPAAPALIAGDEKTDPTPAKAKAARKLKKHAKKLPPPSDPSTTDNPAKP